MVFSLISTLVIIPITVGYGYLFCHRILELRERSLSFGEIGTIGFLPIGILVLFVNFFLPISSFVSAIICISGIIFFISYFKKIRSLFEGPYHLALFFILVFIFGGYAIENGWTGDNGLYHYPALIWLHTSQTMFGLANLHDRFGINSLWFPISSGFWLPLGGLATAFSCCSALAIFFYLILFEPFFLKAKGDISRPSRIFGLSALFFFCLERTYFLKILGNLGTDLPATLVGTLVLYNAIRILEMSFEDQNRYSLIIFEMFLCFLAISIKLSTFPLGILFLYFLYQVRKEIGKTFGTLLSLGAVIFLWVIRGIALSGCLLYPSGRIPFLPWSVTRESTEGISLWIRSWARRPYMTTEEVMKDWKWLVPWAHDTFGSPVIKLSLLFSIIGLAFWCFGLFKKGTSLKGNFLIVPGSCLLGLVFWFYQAPDPRFGFCFIISAGLLLMTQGVLKSNLSMKISAIAKPLALFAFLILINATLELTVRNIIQRPFQKWPDLPHSRPVEFKNEQGEIFYTTESNFENAGQCWDTPHCTPYVNKKIYHDKIGVWEEYRASR